MKPIQTLPRRHGNLAERYGQIERKPFRVISSIEELPKKGPANTGQGMAYRVRDTQTGSCFGSCAEVEAVIGLSKWLVRESLGNRGPFAGRFVKMSEADFLAARPDYQRANSKKVEIVDGHVRLQCSKCRQVLPEDQFARCSATRTRRQGYCRKCK